jgi:hypothetical protein
MKKIRLCIGTNDGKNIAKTHMGDTRYFYIYDLFENSEYEFIGDRINTVKNMDHAKPEKMNEIIKTVKDADIFVARLKSPNFIKIANKTKYQPVVVKEDNIIGSLIIIGRSFQELYDYVIRRRNGDIFDIIPELS